VLPDKIVYLTKKSNNILQLQTTILLKRNTFSLDCIASHVSLVFEKDNSIETLIYPAFSG